MSDPAAADRWPVEANGPLQRATRWIFLAAALLLFVDVGLGIAGVLTGGSVEWQRLTRLRVGTLSWITLAVIGTALGAAGGGETTTVPPPGRLRLPAVLSMATFGALAAGTGLVFAIGDAVMVPVVAFASTVPVLVWAAIRSMANRRATTALTTVRVLFGCGLVAVAVSHSLAAAILLDSAGESVLPVKFALAFDAYWTAVVASLLLVASATVEWLTRQGDDRSWSRSGVAQATAGLAVGCLAPLLIVLEMIVPAVALTVLGLLAFAILFLRRVGGRALGLDLIGSDVGRWVFFGTFWLVAHVTVFIGAPSFGTRAWVQAVTAQTLLAGVMTNLLVGALSARTRLRGDRYAWLESSALWLLNGGLVLYVALEVFGDTVLDTAVLGFGTVLAIGVMAARLLSRSDRPDTPADTADVAGE